MTKVKSKFANSQELRKKHTVSGEYKPYAGISPVSTATDIGYADIPPATDIGDELIKQGHASLPGGRHWEPAAEPTASGSAAAAILREAAGIVEGSRNTTHGDKERSFAAIAALWQTYLQTKGLLAPMTAVDVANMMVLMKMARSLCGTSIQDHYVDMAGYAAIAGELSHG